MALETLLDQSDETTLLQEMASKIGAAGVGAQIAEGLNENYRHPESFNQNSAGPKPPFGSEV